MVKRLGLMAAVIGVCLAIVLPNVMAADFPAKDITFPGKLTDGQTGAGGAWHLVMASLATTNGVEFTYVPFDGAAPSRIALGNRGAGSGGNRGGEKIKK